jgi:hypothetical protein
MRYVYTGGNYREFRGYVFCHGKPVTIKDRGTLAAIARERDFEEYHEPEPVLPEPVVDPDACPKCGRIVKQGRYMHIKYCEGPS